MEKWGISLNQKKKMIIHHQNPFILKIIVQTKEIPHAPRKRENGEF
jgi:hypothetical protein